MLLQLRFYGDPVLRKKTEPVESITDEIRQIAKDLIETMYEEEGVGLAAPQVGISKRLFAIDTSTSRKEGKVLVNPEIVSRQGQVVMEEGCLSFPGIYGKIERSEKIRLRGKTVDGEDFDQELDGLSARAVLHELDHLEGVLFVDHMTPSQKIVLQSKLKKLAKQTKKQLGKL